MSLTERGGGGGTNGVPVHLRNKRMIFSFSSSFNKSMCEVKRGKGKTEEFKFCTGEDHGVFQSLCTVYN